MDKAERQQRKSKIRRMELLVWLVLISICLLIGCFLHMRYEASFEHHKIYMPDVDGLIVGSPVHMMGTSIGYVDKVEIVSDNEIEVRFKITNKSVHVPPGTFATVEFNGMGGSKSLEIYTASSGKIPNEVVGKNDYILVDRPKRLRDSMSLLYQMYEKLMDIMYTSANFANSMKKINTGNIPVGDISDMNHFIDYADSYLDKYSGEMQSIRKMLFRGNRRKYNE